MTCSPKINKERQEVGQRPCNSECCYWKECLKELKIDNAAEEEWVYRYQKC